MTGKQIKVLLVEDNPGDAFLIKDHFRKTKARAFELTHVTFLDRAIINLEKNDFDIILLDLLLPDSQGLDTLLAIEEKAPRVPVVILTGMDDEELAIRAVRQGAQDYLVKGQVLGELLVHSLRYAIERKQIQEELKKRSLELEVLNGELEAFSYAVSHDLRNPLTTIKGMTDLLKEFAAPQLSEKHLSWFEFISEASERMEQIIKALLMLSQVKRNQLNIQSVNLSDVAQQIIIQLQQQQPERQVEVVISSPIIVSGDKHLLQIALENLLNNAWKYTGEKDKARIEFGVIPPTEKQRMETESTLSVNYLENGINQEFVYFLKDNGAGFDMQNADKLFTPFQRLENSHSFKGTGVGLSIVQRIVHRHGGEIWAEAAVGRGAAFYFTLPMLTKSTQSPQTEIIY